MSVPPDLPVVLIDDDRAVLRSTRLLLRSAGVRRIELIEDSRQVCSALDAHGAAVIVLDLFMPHRPGTELLPELVSASPQVPIIVMTAAQEVDTAVACMKAGAFDYLVKPVEEQRFISSVKRALELRSLRVQVGALKDSLLHDRLHQPDAFANIITRSRKMRAIFQYVEAVARSSEPLLIMGQTGVGKGLLAQAAHDCSARTGPLVKVNVAGLDDALFSDTLFGHRKGAYSGAEDRREGLVAQASGGSLFLDEIGDLKKASQVKLLRLIQEQEYYPLGSDVPRRSDVRVICATNRDLRARIEKGRFRQDLFYRLSVHQVVLPELCERVEDLPSLIDHFIREATSSMGKPELRAPTELSTLLAVHAFPGNVRELRSMVFDAVATQTAGPVLSMERFREVVAQQREQSASGPPAAGWQLPTPFPTLRQAEDHLIHTAMERAQGNQGVAATLLGISRPSLNRRLAKLGARRKTGV